MEQSRYLMWTTRRKLISGRPHLQSLTPAGGGASYNDYSWEELAFAEDSAGPLGGCIWPPRSYSCSFCRREFRSAQALGGHMNVHRRDRARLKQSPTPPQHQLHHHHQPNPCTWPPLAAQHPPQVCTLVYNNNPNPVVVPAPLSPSRASAASTQEKYCSEHTLVSPSYSDQEHHKGSLLFSNTLRTDSDPVSLQILTAVPGLKLGSTDQNLKLKVMGHRRGKRDTSDRDEEEVISSKRWRTTTADVPPTPFSVRAGVPLGDPGRLQSQLFGLVVPNPIEELDLELRLGNRPKVK